MLTVFVFIPGILTLAVIDFFVLIPLRPRTKRSGQRWSDEGAQNMLNLGVAYKSGKADLIIQIITGRPASGKAKS